MASMVNGLLVGTILCLAVLIIGHCDAAGYASSSSPDPLKNKLHVLRRSLNSRFSRVAADYGIPFGPSASSPSTTGVAAEVPSTKGSRAYASPLHHTAISPRHRESAPNDAGYYSVADYGAVPDGVTDNTHAFAAALSAGAGSRVFVPAGTYNFLGQLVVPPNTALVGVDEFPFRSTGGGSVLTVGYEGGNATGTPFLFLQGPNSGVDGLAILYTKQNVTSDSPMPYPPCIQGSGDDISVLNTLLVNPFFAVDFATYPCGRHLIDNLYGQPLSVGVAVDQCYDIGRIRNVHFWTFWTPYPSPMAHYIELNAVAFHFLRTDWEIVQDVFAFGYNRGMVFDQSSHGSCNGQFSNINFDDTGVGIDVKVSQLAGLQFSNVNLATDGNQGANSVAIQCDGLVGISKVVVRGLSAWGNWQQHVRWNCPVGVLSVSDSLFLQWNGTLPAVEGILGRLHVHNSFFSDLVGKGILVHATLDRAVISGNDMVGNSLECEGEDRVCSNNLL